MPQLPIGYGNANTLLRHSCVSVEISRLSHVSSTFRAPPCKINSWMHDVDSWIRSIAQRFARIWLATSSARPRPAQGCVQMSLGPRTFSFAQQPMQLRAWPRARYARSPRRCVRTAQSCQAPMRSVVVFRTCKRIALASRRRRPAS